MSQYQLVGKFKKERKQQQLFRSKLPVLRDVLIKLNASFLFCNFQITLNMKKIFLSFLCILTVCLVNAQSQFGIISYSLPQGWYARQSGNDLELVKKGAENSGCKITLFQQVNFVVNGERKFVELWASKTKTGNTKTPSPVKTEEDGWISFSGFKTMGKGTTTEGFYTVCDGSQTAIILAEAQESSCINEINSILASITIPEKETNSKTKAKAKPASKKVRVLPLKSLKALVN